MPDRLHYIWIGRSLPWFAKLSIESALLSCPDAQISLWAFDDLEGDSHVSTLRDDPRFQLHRLSERVLFEDAPQDLPLDLLARLFFTLEQPPARANLARMLLLSRLGGIYLDTDTLTVRDFSPLRSLGAFCGLERVIWPLGKRYGIHPYRVIGGPMRGLFRNLCAQLPDGERLFARAARWYSLAANNAVLGFSPNHPFLHHMLTLVGNLREDEWGRRYRLGTHLLQQALADAGARLGVRTLPPSAFYPLGPELSRQYFRPRRDVASAAQRILGSGSYVVHWYASVSELALYDEARVRSERDKTLFGYLGERALSGRPPLPQWSANGAWESSIGWPDSSFATSARRRGPIT